MAVFLKTLTLKGFKSFAEPTTVDLEPGITVVVGPNGSGKSNVVDAVAWVLGAQGPRTVRSSKMDDVIFAGSARRPALGRAEVALTIDNSSGRLPVGLAEVTITRTLWRSGESEYAINGASCRLLDVQELLSDSGVGRQQHVIVGQGQLDAVLNARPEDRRLIVEEAAGVLKYRRRRERTERRLTATEGDLARLGDLLREVRRQLRPLERQADAARRYDALVGEHRAIRLYLAGREMADARGRLDAIAVQRSELDTRSEDLRRRLRHLDAEVDGAEARVASHRVDGLTTAVARLEALRERGRGLAAVVAERRRSVERSLQAAVEEGVVAALEAEAARVGAELAEANDAAGELIPLADELAGGESALAEERAASAGVPTAPGPGTEPGAGAGAEPSASELRGRLSALTNAAARERAEEGQARAELDDLADRAQALSEQAARHRGEIEQAEQAERPIVAALEEAAARRSWAEEEVGQADARLAALEQERRSWSARAEALALALAQVRARGGGEHLAGLPGLLGTLAELVEVDQGWEAAFEAAAGEAVASVVLTGVAEAAGALEHLHTRQVSGAVLAASAPATDAAPALAGEGGAVPVAGEGGAAEGVVGRQAPAGPDRHLPPGAVGVRHHVRAAHPAVEALLDALLGLVVAVEGDWRAALDLSLSEPSRVVVTRHGDRFGPDGWRVGSAGPGVTGAALTEAEGKAAAAAEAVRAAAEALEGTRAQLGAARQAETDLARALDDNDSRLGAAADALQRVEIERQTLVTRQQSGRAHLEGLLDRLRRDEAEITELRASLPSLEAAESAAAERAQRAQAARSALDQRTAALAALRTDLEVRAAALEERRALLTRRLAEIEQRLARTVQARREAASRRRSLELAATATARLEAVLAGSLATLEAELDGLRERRRQRAAVLEEQTAVLARLRQERGGLESGLVEVQERGHRADIAQAELRLRYEAAIEAVRRDLDAEPDTALDAPCPELPGGVTAAQRGRELERELRLIGPVNPLAVAELESLEERAGFLDGQLEDVKAARRELARVIRAIDAEIVAVFTAAYADVARHFADLFATLFPGGAGSLSLTDPANLLETGIEVAARPAGKNVRKLSLLSGGERSLVALAFLFAVFRSRPSPFYLMDEVEAALDDINLHRFLALIDEFRAEAQLVIVSHQKRTMEVADSLYGVSMQPGGSSRVVSERLRAVAPQG